jgi:hypothetical protein
MYIIWTENKNAIDVIAKVTEMFGADNVVHGQGHYNGKGEESLRIEIFHDGLQLFNLRVYDLARWIAQHNDQESVAVLRQDDPNLVRPEEFGDEDNLGEPEGVYDTTPDDGPELYEAALSAIPRTSRFASLRAALRRAVKNGWNIK